MARAVVPAPAARSPAASAPASPAEDGTDQPEHDEEEDQEPEDPEKAEAVAPAVPADVGSRGVAGRDDDAATAGGDVLGEARADPRVVRRHPEGGGSDAEDDHEKDGCDGSSVHGWWSSAPLAAVVGDRL